MSRIAAAFSINQVAVECRNRSSLLLSQLKCASVSIVNLDVQLRYML